MNSRLFFRSFFIVITSFIVFTKCFLFDEIDLDFSSKNMKIETPVLVLSETISSSGGSIVVKEGELGGMQIDVPDKAFSSTTTFTITSSKITSHKLGGNFIPITPLIQIDNGGGYANGIIELTIPITLSEGEIPLGFYYDEIEGKLEAIPVKEYTQKTVTLLTRHFMGANLLHYEGNNKAKRVKKDASANIVVGSLSESLLKLSPTISTNFEVGKDDWEFVNYGSYIASGGHCAGQNMAAFWYYYEQTLKNEDPLFGRFSTHDNMWQDNFIGYKFCSVIHRDLEWEGKVANFLENYIDKNQELDRMKFNLIAGAMLVTGEPQGIGIYRQTGTDEHGEPIFGGHDLICYKVATNEGKLFISDPNKPGIEQSIILKNGKFDPYIAKLNGNDASNPYPFITWYAKTAYIEWDKIGERFSELKDSTIGYNPPNNFPAYKIWIVGKPDIELTKDYVPESDTLKYYVEFPSAQIGYQVDGKNRTGSILYDSEGKVIGSNKPNGIKEYILKPGANKIGIYVVGWKSNKKYDNGNYIDYFIDFKWFSINNSKLKIEPNPLIGEPNNEVEFEAIYESVLPASAKFVWDFGDNSPTQTIMNDKMVKHIYEKEGEYTVSLKLSNGNTNTLLGEANARAVIAPVNDIIALLHTMKRFDVSSTFVFALNDGTDYRQGFSDQTSDSKPLIWNRNEFSTNYESKGEYSSSGDKADYKWGVKGVIADDGKSIKSLTWERQDDIYRYHKWFESHSEKIEIKDIPLIHKPGDSNWPLGTYDDFYYKLAKSELMSKVVQVEWRWWDADGKNQVYAKSRLKFFDDDLNVWFKKENN